VWGTFLTVTCVTDRHHVTQWKILGRGSALQYVVDSNTWSSLTVCLAVSRLVLCHCVKHGNIDFPCS